MRSASGDLDGGFGAGLGVLHDVLVIQRRDRRMRVALACPPHTPRVSAQLTSAHARARAGHLHLGVEGGQVPWYLTKALMCVLRPGFSFTISLISP